MTQRTSDHPADLGGEHQIDLWLTYYHEISDAALQGELRALLSDDEREQETRFHFADDRLRYLVTRALVRTVLSRYAAVAPIDWEFARNAYGRPEIAPRHGPLGLCFNISHTRGLIALAVSRHRALGVDVENVVARPASSGIGERFFAPSEAAELASLPPGARPHRFFEYWTFKESYIKARGMGLSLPLDAFSFHFPDARTVRIAFDDGVDDAPGRWCFWQCRPTPEYLLALCAERRDGAAPAITVRTVIPTAHAAPCALDWLRTTST